MAALPEQVAYFHVKWKGLAATPDTADADALPDAVPVTGTVTLTPSHKDITVPNAVPPVTVFLRPVPCVIDGGVMKDEQGHEQVPLVYAPGLRWTATFALSDGDAHEPITFSGAPGAVVDLSGSVPLIGLDTDGVPHYHPDGVASGIPLYLDTDDVPYFVP